MKLPDKVLALQNRWQQLGYREKLIYLSAAFFGLIVLYFLIIWYPLSLAIADTRNKIIADQKLLTFIAENKEKLAQLRSMPKITSISNSSLLATIDQEAKNSVWGTVVTSMKQTENDQVELVFNQISFDELIMGLEDLWKKNHVQVDKINIERLENENGVRATINLRS